MKGSTKSLLLLILYIVFLFGLSSWVVWAFRTEQESLRKKKIDCFRKGGEWVSAGLFDDGECVLLDKETP